MLRYDGREEPIVITGIGLITSLGHDRETIWQAVRAGKSGARRIQGVEPIPDGLIVACQVDLPHERPNQFKVIDLAQHAAREALADAHLNGAPLNRERIGCAISGHMGDPGHIPEKLGLLEGLPANAARWWAQWLPNTACSNVANRHHLYGPRICHSTACASGMIDLLAAVRAIQNNECDVALAGSAEAIHPLFVAGFHNMKVLADDDDPQNACRPFDVSRKGFIMGEGAGMFVIERLGHARARGARVYAQVLAGKALAEAHHPTGIDQTSEPITRLIGDTLQAARVEPTEIDYISVHGTGTEQNDVAEARAIHRVFGKAEHLAASSMKAAIGHLVNASGSVELALTCLAIRDRFAPPTLNLRTPDPECRFNCVPRVGQPREIHTAMKLSVAFGGHLAAVVIRRWKNE